MSLYAQNLKKNLTLFLSELIEQFPAEGDLVIARIFLTDMVPPEQLIKTFADEVLPMADKIAARDERFFLDYPFPIGKADHFKRLWTSGQLDADDKEVMWKWFDLFIQLTRAERSHAARS
jgi:hypothetical protein